MDWTQDDGGSPHSGHYSASAAALVASGKWQVASGKWKSTMQTRLSHSSI